MNLSKWIFKTIKEFALESAPNECCGFLLDIDNSIHIFKCKNSAEDSLNNFLISPKEYIKASLIGKILYSYHSHPSEKHSDNFTLLDKLNSIEHKIPMIVYNITNDKFSFFEDNHINSEYIGQPFEYNKNDCLSLVERFYEKEFKIQFIKRNRDENTIKDDPKIFIRNIDNYGFQELTDKEELKYGDIIITNSAFGPTHLMIFIGNNEILHHRIHGYSTTEIYSNLYKKNTVKRIRHKNNVNRPN